MAFPKNKKSALLALATAGGVWAWQNRTKLASMWQEMQSNRRSEPLGRTTGSMNTPMSNSPLSGTNTSGTTMGDTPYTDATTRLRDKEIGRDF